MKNSLLIFFLFCIQITWAQKTLIPYKNGKLWGYANETGNMIITPKYDSVALFSKEGKSLAIVSENKKMGVIDENGKEILPNIYKKIEHLEERRMYGTKSKSFFAEKENGMLDLYSEDRKINSDIQKIKTVAGNFILVQKNNKLGLYDDDGKEILPIVYNQIDYVKSDNYSRETIQYRISSDQETQYIFLKLTERDRYSNIYNSVGPPPPNGNELQEISKKHQLEITKCVDGNSHCIYKTKNKFGYINLETNQRLKAEYDDLQIQSTFKNFYLIAKKDNKTALLDVSGAILLPFDMMDLSVKQSFAEIEKDNKKGFYFFDSKKTISPKYNAVKGYLYEDYIEVVNDILLKRLYDKDSKDWFYVGSNGIVYKSIN